jgi:peptidoglycan-associated lipoprotein
MMLSKQFGFSIVFSSIVALTLAGCTDDEAQVEEPVRSAVGSDDHPAKNEFSIDGKGNVKFQAEIVYFGFDQSSLTDEGKGQISAIAAYLNKNKKMAVKVQGHSDERGSTEYNLALGLARTKSVIKYLQDLGIDDKRLSAISYGEEKPQAQGHSEQAWQKNRRADFMIHEI